MPSVTVGECGWGEFLGARGGFPPSSLSPWIYLFLDFGAKKGEPRAGAGSRGRGGGSREGSRGWPGGDPRGCEESGRAARAPRGARVPLPQPARPLHTARMDHAEVYPQGTAGCGGSAQWSRCGVSAHPRPGTRGRPRICGPSVSRLFPAERGAGPARCSRCPGPAPVLDPAPKSGMCGLRTSPHVPARPRAAPRLPNSSGAPRESRKLGRSAVGPVPPPSRAFAFLARFSPF